MDNIRTRIKAKRKELGITQGELAKSLGVSLTTVSDWETGKAEANHHNLASLAESLGVTLDWLLTGKGPQRITRALDFVQPLTVAAPNKPNAPPANDVKDKELQRLIIKLETLPVADRKAIELMIDRLLAHGEGDCEDTHSQEAG